MKKNKIKFIISILCLCMIFLMTVLVKINILPEKNNIVLIGILLLGFVGIIFIYPYMKELHDANSSRKPPFS